MKKNHSVSNVVLIGLALLSILVYALVENTRAPVQQPYYKQKLEAARLSQLAQKTLTERVNQLNIPIDAESDPSETGLIGEQFTPVTTDIGVLSAKLASLNIDFAAAYVDMFYRAGVSKGDLIAVAQTGSFPALNISLYAAMKALELQPVIISSVGSSSWGSTNPDFTWLDMESYLIERGIFHFQSTAVSLGGGGDRGRGLSPQGRKLLIKAVERNIEPQNSENSIEFIHKKNLRESIDRRLEIFMQLERDRKKPLKMFINIGGGIASLGSTQNGRLIRPGLSRDLTKAEFPVEGVITRMAERGAPIIHMLSIKRIAEKYGINPTPYTDENATIGLGPLYYREQYSIWVTVLATIFLLTIIIVLLRIDVKHYLFARKKK